MNLLPTRQVEKLNLLAIRVEKLNVLRHDLIIS